MHNMRKLKILSYISFFVIILTVLFSHSSFASPAKELLDKLRAKASGVLILNEDPILVEDSTKKGSTKDFNIGLLTIEPGKTITVAQADTGGIFYDIWYSVNSPLIQATIWLDDGKTWQEDTSVFCSASMYNKKDVGFGGATGCGEVNSPTNGPIWSGYITPPNGYMFKKNMRVEFKNLDTTSKIIHSVRGHYAIY